MSKFVLIFTMAVAGNPTAPIQLGPYESFETCSRVAAAMAKDYRTRLTFNGDLVAWVCAEVPKPQ